MKYAHVLENINSSSEVPVKIEYRKTTRAGGVARKRAGTWLVVVPPPVDLETLFIGVHELGHCVNSHWKLSCLREYYSDLFAMEWFKRLGLPITKDIESNHKWYIAYSLAQALNRGLKRVPEQLKRYRKYLMKDKKCICCRNGKYKVVSRYYAFTP